MESHAPSSRIVAIYSTIGILLILSTVVFNATKLLVGSIPLILGLMGVASLLWGASLAIKRRRLMRAQ